jgi:hypothetical protein
MGEGVPGGFDFLGERGAEGDVFGLREYGPGGGEGHLECGRRMVRGRAMGSVG